MKKLRRLSIIITLLVGVFIFTGCGKENESEEPTFKLVYDVDREVDKIKYKINDDEMELEPMSNDTKIKKGKISNVTYTDIDSAKFSVEIIDKGNTLYNKENIELDFSNNKKAVVSIIENDNGDFDIKVENK